MKTQHVKTAIVEIVKYTTIPQTLAKLALLVFIAATLCGCLVSFTGETDKITTAAVLKIVGVAALPAIAFWAWAFVVNVAIEYKHVAK